mmetsp:Transcript_30233/g.60081  ORF Transcript_30233/g.60081 Transcript_30233/m.60081 type:complete len:420 (-) Transcript_30233:30-1289(-)
MISTSIPDDMKPNYCDNKTTTINNKESTFPAGNSYDSSCNNNNNNNKYTNTNNYPHNVIRTTPLHKGPKQQQQQQKPKTGQTPRMIPDLCQQPCFSNDTRRRGARLREQLDRERRGAAGTGGAGDDDDDDEISSVFIPHDLPPDEQVKKMTVVVSDTLRGINIGQFFNSFWRDKPGSEFYGPWLETKKSEKVKVGGWEKNRHEHKFSKEVFSHKRVATFDYPRTTHLWVGPPMAGVTQAHYARIDDGARCIIAMSVEMNGIPYADVFAVEVRWVATNVADKVIEIEVGVAVDFKKSSMFKGQIRSGTEEETGAIHMSLFEEMKRRVGEMAAEAGEELEQEAGPGAAEGAVVVREEKVVVAAGGWLGEKGFLAVLLVAFAVVFWDLHQQKRLVRELMVNTAELQEDIRALVKELERKMIQ